jgi:peptidoglycan/LPS O-acetylase OafA/YrhL
VARGNHFSLLRVGVAALVVLSHSFDLIDGNSDRQPVYRLFGTVTFGELAVDGFFIVSGFLITRSFLGSGYAAYLGKRVLRIYPGFLVAFVVSIVIAQEFSGHSLWLPGREVAHNALNAIFLLGADLENPFPGQFYPAANGSMWTISYEFHCYLAVMALGAVGLLRRRWLVFLLGVGLLAALAAVPAQDWPAVREQTEASIGFAGRFWQRVRDFVVEAPFEDVRLFAMFLAGACFYLFRDAVVYRGWMAGLALAGLTGCLFFGRLAEPGFAVLGGYLIFWAAFFPRPLWISGFLTRVDLSYGIYLYAFPIQKAVISLAPRVQPYELFVVALALSAAAAWVSWTLVEKPCLALKAWLPRLQREASQKQAALF